MNVNKFLLCVFILISILGFGQNRSGRIIYKTILNENTVDDKNYKKPTLFQKQIFDAGSRLSFELIFNDDVSEHKLIKKLSTDKNDFPTEMAIFILRGNSVFYCDSDNKVLIENREYLGEQLTLKKPLNSFNWKLTNETKQINGYICYKATGIKYGSDKEHNTTETPITLWYTPQINFNYGPFESCGLPGLVLEYGMGKYIWTAQDIILNNDKIDINISAPGTQVTEEEILNELKKKIKS